MSVFLRRFLAGLFCTVVALPSIAQDTVISPEAKIREVLERTQPGMEVSSVRASEVPGMYMITLTNLQTIFASADARFFIPGDLYALTDDGYAMINVGEQLRNRSRLAMVNAVPESEMIIFPAEGESLATLTAFTDVDCPYCRKLHGDVKALNEMGITVRYLAFPREGLDTPTYATMVSTWCAEDRKLYFTVATRGGDVPVANCDSPIAGHYQLGREVGVEGTPALILEDGSIVNGYIPAETLAPYLLGQQN